MYLMDPRKRNTLYTVTTSDYPSLDPTDLFGTPKQAIYEYCKESEIDTLPEDAKVWKVTLSFKEVPRP